MANAEGKTVYRFPDHGYTVTFPCEGKLDKTTTQHELFLEFTANMKCNKRDAAYTAVYYQFARLENMEKSSDEDKYVFLEEFSNMVRELTTGDTGDFVITEKVKTKVSALPALRMEMTSANKEHDKMKISAQAVVNKNNALYLSSLFAKNREDKDRNNAFFESVKVGDHEWGKPQEFNT